MNNLEAFQSLKSATLAKDQLKEADALIKSEHLQDIIDLPYRFNEFNEHSEDILYSAESITTGALMSDEEDAPFQLVVVKGDLTVTGNLVIQGDDPIHAVVVSGDLHVEGSLLVAGVLEVQGSTSVNGVLVGDYNHGHTVFHGPVKANDIVDNDEYAMEFLGCEPSGNKPEVNDLEALLDVIRSGAAHDEVKAALSK